ASDCTELPSALLPSGSEYTVTAAPESCQKNCTVALPTTLPVVVDTVRRLYLPNMLIDLQAVHDCVGQGHEGFAIDCNTGLHGREMLQWPAKGCLAWLTEITTSAACRVINATGSKRAGRFATAYEPTSTAAARIEGALTRAR